MHQLLLGSATDSRGRQALERVPWRSSTAHSLRVCLPSFVPSRDPAVALHARERLFLSNARAHARYRRITMRLVRPSAVINNALAPHSSLGGRLRQPSADRGGRAARHGGTDAPGEGGGAASPPKRSPAVVRLSGYGDRMLRRSGRALVSPVMLSTSRPGAGASASQRLGRTARRC
jgi:hypothetical protein